MFFISHLTIAVYIWVSFLESVLSEEEMKSGYGNSWLLFVDDQSNTHVMNFSVLPGRGMHYGLPNFHLFTRRNQNAPELLNIPPKNSYINSTYFNKSNDIRVLIHGWMSTDQTNWVQGMKDMILLNNDVNVITVDWGSLAKNSLYPWSALSTRYVGRQTAKFLDACTKSFGVQRGRMHLIGHSLGAHVVGYTGMFMNSEVHRITGLDPARPLFEYPKLPAAFRLDKSDAMFVDIIHTCGGLFGYKYSQGHADFYPNEGKAVQPGCEGESKFIVKHRLKYDMNGLDSCSHGRSTIYFEESIEYIYGKGFLAYPCDSWKKFTNGYCTENKTSMGYHTDTHIRGDYYLRTNNGSKYAIDE